MACHDQLAMPVGATEPGRQNDTGGPPAIPDLGQLASVHRNLNGNTPDRQPTLFAQATSCCYILKKPTLPLESLFLLLTPSKANRSTCVFRLIPPQ